ncbi:hypothetical protein DYB32_002708 [Aphanomyces invadans]|nr:hypothetical protein DYB32_002708 [Aphanomyces invadans]
MRPRWATSPAAKVPIHRKVIHPGCQWKPELHLSMARPIAQLEVMSKPKVVQLLVVYYLFAFAFLPIIALDTSSIVVVTPAVSCRGSECTGWQVHTRVSPFCSSMSLVVSTSASSLVFVFPLGAPTPRRPPLATAVLTVEPVEGGPRQTCFLANWSTTAQDASLITVESAAVDVNYAQLFGVDINLFSAVDVSFELDPTLQLRPFDTMTIAWRQRFVSPFVTLYCSCTVMAIDVMSVAYFWHRVRLFRHSQPTVSLPQWRWIVGMLMALMLQIQIPFSIAQFVYTMAGTAMPAALLQVSFWLYLVGKNSTRFFVLCFADGMDRTTESLADRGHVRFYTIKAATVAALTILQGINYELKLPPDVADVLVLVITVLEFATQGLIVLWYWARRGREIRTFPYKTAKFRYVTYGVLSFLVVPEAIGSLITLLKRAAWSLSTPTSKSLAWLAALVRLQAFAWMVLQCYLPLQHDQLLQTSPERKSFALNDDDNDDGDDDGDDRKRASIRLTMRTFNLTTAVVMLNCSVTSYFDTLAADQSAEDGRSSTAAASPCPPPSPSSFGRIGLDIIHPNAYNIHVIRTFHGAATDTNALLLHDTAFDRYIVSFRGTGSLKNGLTDVKSRQVLFPGVEFTAPRKALHRRYHRSDVYVHLGFWQAYKTLQAAIHDAVRQLPRPPLAPLQIYCTGHSLGGALATLCAVDLALAQPNVAVTMYNFGSPRVGNHAFRLLFNAIVSGFRVVNDGDVVTQMPKRDYTSVSRNGVGIYKHVGTEVVLLSSGVESNNVDGRRSFRGLVVQPTIVDRVFVLAMRTKLSSHTLESYRQSFRSLISHEPSFDRATDTRADGVPIVHDEHAACTLETSGGDAAAAEPETTIDNVARPTDVLEIVVDGVMDQLDDAAMD